MWSLKVIIASKDITSHVISGYVECSLIQEISKAELQLKKTIDNELTLTNEQTIVIYRSYSGNYTDNEILFRGTLVNIEEHDYFYKLICFDKLNKLRNTMINKVYIESEGKISDIFTDIVVNYCGLNADSTTIKDSGLMSKLNRFVCRNAYAYERCKKLADTINWYFYYNPRTDKVYFEPRQYTTNPNTINENVLTSTINWEDDTTELYNVLTVSGANIQTQTTEYFSGNGSKTVFALAYKPESIKVYVGGSLKKGGQYDTPNTDYYIEKESKNVYFRSAPPSGTNNIQVDYSYSSPLQMRLTRPVSIIVYGEKHKYITFNDVTTTFDLQTRANELIDTYSKPFIISKFKVKNTIDYGYRVGQKILINDTLITHRTETLVIRKIKYNLRTIYDEIECGDKEFRLDTFITFNVEYRVKKLEEEMVKDIDILYNLIQLSHSITHRRKSIRRIVNRINDSFVLGHPVNGILGRGKVLEDFEGGVSSWSGSSCSITSETGAGNYIVGSKSMKITSSATSWYVQNTSLGAGDLSRYTEVSSGNPTSGTIGLWLKVANISDVSAISIQVGSDSSNYKIINGVKTYTNVFGLETGWNYFVFRLKNYSGGSGTPNWASVNYLRVTLNGLSSKIVYLDYITIGTGNEIGLNGLGNRTTEYINTLTIY